MNKGDKIRATRTVEGTVIAAEGGWVRIRREDGRQADIGLLGYEIEVLEAAQPPVGSIVRDKTDHRRFCLRVQNGEWVYSIGLLTRPTELCTIGSDWATVKGYLDTGDWELL